MTFDSFKLSLLSHEVYIVVFSFSASEAKDNSNRMRYFHTQIWHDKVICTIQRTSPQVTPEDRKEKHTEAKTQVDDKEPAVSLTSCSYSMYPNPLGFPALLVTSRISLILPCCNKKKCTLFECQCIYGTQPFYVVIGATRRSSRLQGKGSTFISQLF